MSIPDYQTIMLPLLTLAGDCQARSKSDIVALLADHFKLAEEERREMLKSGNMTLFSNRCGWAISYLKQAGLLSYPQRGKIQITGEGLQVLSRKPSKITNKDLMEFESFKNFIGKSRSTKQEDAPSRITDTDKTPLEQFESSYQSIRQSLIAELLDRIKVSPPQFLESLVIKLMLAMGYGGTSDDSGQLTSYTNDEGIDGIIKEDRLGLDMIYLQAKRWENPVSRPEIQKFLGALSTKRAKKGVYITTSRFTTEATECLRGVDCSVVLIDGQRLAELMVDFGVGVQLNTVYEIKKIDEDFFAGDEG